MYKKYCFILIKQLLVYNSILINKFIMSHELTEQEQSIINNNLCCDVYSKLVKGTMMSLRDLPGRDRYMGAMIYFLTEVDNNGEECTLNIKNNPMTSQLLLWHMENDARFLYGIATFGITCKCEENRLARLHEEMLQEIHDKEISDRYALSAARAEKKYQLELERFGSLEAETFFAAAKMFEMFGDNEVY